MAMPQVLNRVTRFLRDNRANVAVTFAIASIPTIGAVGVAVDYSMATRMQAKLQSAADTAAVASISQNSAGYLQASQMLTDGLVPNGATEASNIFNGNAANATGYQNKTVTPTVTKTGSKLTSTVTWSAQVPVTFTKVFNLLGANWQYLTISGSSQATASLPLYLDFYLMLDVSGSMGLPSTASEANRLQWLNPDNYRQYPTGCTLACHFPFQNAACTDSGTQGYPTNGYCLGYMISRVSPSGYLNLLQIDSTKSYPYVYNGDQTTSSKYGKHLVLPSTVKSGLPNSLNNSLPPVANCPTPGTDNCIQLRLDAVGYAVNQLLATANSPTYLKIPNQFRVGLYPYITSLYTSYAPLTSNLTGSAITTAAANLATLLDTNTNSNLGSGGTNQDAALYAMNNLISSVGDGSASNNTIPYVFMITDGAVTPQTKGVPNGGWSGSNHDTVIPTPDQNCTNLRSKGVKVSILYIPYVPINPVNASFANDEDDYANNNIPNISKSLQACASPGFYYEANTPQDIADALKAMFQHALVEAHVSN